MNVYEKLKRIRKPVLIAVFQYGFIHKFRILRPNGLCTWNSLYNSVDIEDYTWDNNELFTGVSCFVDEPKFSLKQTVTNMKRYDKSRRHPVFIEIVGTIEL